MEQSIYSTIDSLDYLIPPIKRKTKSSNKLSDINEINLFQTKKCKTQKRNNKQTLFNHDHEEVKTSSSVILRSFTKEIVREKYSLFNLYNQNLYNKNLPLQNIPKNQSINTEKGLIKVIIKPKLTKAKTQEIFKTQRASNAVKNISIPHSCLSNNHICYAFRGRQYVKEKIYDVKTTESDTLSNNFKSKNGSISLKQMINYKRILETLNMEPNKSMNKRKKSPQLSFKYGDCECPIKSKGPCKKLVEPRNRVTLVGQLGQTDKNYVLQYGATLNDNPIEVKNTSWTKNLICSCNNLENMNSKRDRTVQTEFCCSNVVCISRFQNEISKKRITSQGTQVNLNFSNYKDMSQKCNLDTATIPTTCTNTNSLQKEFSCERKTEVVPLKDCQSPLVIISVYPRQDASNISIKNTLAQKKKNQRNQSPKSQNSANISKEKSVTNKKDTSHIINTTKITRSRTPSPPKNVIKNYSVTKSVYTKKQINNNSKLKTQNDHRKENKNMNDLKNCFCNQISNKESDFVTKAEINHKINRSAQEVKKALIDNFMRNSEINDRYSNYLLHVPKENASKVTININDENDNYDFVFEKNNLTNDLKIRKKSRNKTSQEYGNNDNDTNNIENYLMLSRNKGHTNSSVCKSKNSSQPTKMCYNTTLREQAMSPRVSLEMPYRLEKRSVQKKARHESRKERNLESEAIAVVKHFRGDNCSITDPNERDREIKKLLGVLRGQKAERNKIDNDENKSLEKIQQHQKCFKNVITEYSLLQLVQRLKRKTGKASTHTSPCEVITSTSDKIDTPSPRVKITVKIEKKVNVDKTSYKNDVAAICKNILEVFKNSSTAVCNKEKIVQQSDVCENGNAPEIYENPSCKCLCNTFKDQNLTENLISNRHVQVFLQLDQFPKQKPMTLTKNQYEKLRKVIKLTLSRQLIQEKRPRSSFKACSIVSVGEVKTKFKSRRKLYNDMETQTELIGLNKQSKLIQTNKRERSDMNCKTNSSAKNSTDMVVNTVTKSDTMHVEPLRSDSHSRSTVSSLEIHFANISHTNHGVTTSFLCQPTGPYESIHTREDSKSIHTLFKGRKRSVTPNLGTSMVSLCSNVSATSNIFKSQDNNVEMKQKKSLLRRLISCLVMRSNPITPVNVGALQVSPRTVSAINSTDSYHFSTSLGAIEMSSALYDTTASFYSNHTVLLPNKDKRGFFSSVRGFLANKR